MSAGRAVVFGLGRFGGGAGAARRLAREGYDVLVTDLRGADVLAPTLEELRDVPLRFALGGHREEDFDGADLVVVNPAVPRDHALLERARRAGVALTTEVELFLERAPNPLCGVTGTQGKSSTVRMATDLLVAAGIPARAGGNLGGSLLDALDELASDEVCVLELSSYQLEHLGAPPPRMRAVGITNVLVDHLDRHGTLRAYAAAKRRLLDCTAEDGVAFVPADDPQLDDWRPPRGTRVDLRGDGRGLFVSEGVFRRDGIALGRASELGVPGAFQRDNALLALGLAHAFGASPSALAQALPRLRGLAHRVERLGVFAGREVIDNGVSTTPDSTLAALVELRPGATLLVGGRAKGELSFDALVDAALHREDRVIAFGASGPELAERFRGRGVRTDAVETVEEAVALSLASLDPGPILFSPACASFDAYPNFRARALAFRAALPDAEASAPPRRTP